MALIGKWKIKTTSKIVSLNHYKSLHWRKLKKLIDPLKLEFKIKIKMQKIPLLKWMELTVLHNTRLDMDNVSGTIKPFVDCLRDAKVITDDTYKEWDILIIKSDKTLPKKTVIFEITGEIKNKL